MTFEEIQKEIRNETKPVMDFEEFYNEMIKNDPLFFKDYYLSFSFNKDSIIIRSLKDYSKTSIFSYNADLSKKKEIQKYFEKFNFFSTGFWGDNHTYLLNIESIRNLLNSKTPDYEFSDIENDNQLVFTNNKNNNSHVPMSFSSKRFEKYLTDKEKEKLNMQIKMLEIKRRERITEQHKQDYEESKKKLEEMKSNLTEEERLILTLRGII